MSGKQAGDDMDHHLTVCLLVRSRKTCCQRKRSACWLECDVGGPTGNCRGVSGDSLGCIPSDPSSSVGVSATTCDAALVQCSISVGAVFVWEARKTALRTREALPDVVDCPREILVGRCQGKRERHDGERNSTSDIVAGTWNLEEAADRTASRVVAVSPTTGAALPTACW